MPALPIADDATAPRLDSLAPRDLESSSLTPRHPAVQFTSENAIDTDVLSQRAILQPRQITQGIIPTYYRVDGPGPAAVAGIVLGSVAGILLILWLLYSLTTTTSRRSIVAGEEEIVVRRPRRNSHSGRSRRSTRTEVREYSRSPRRSGGRSTVIVEERRAPRPRSIVVESRVHGDDVVEVIEEEDDYHVRRGGRRNSGYR